MRLRQEVQTLSRRDRVSTEKRLRLDLAIALAALLISTVTALASIYQSRVISNQLSASVWPYLLFTLNFQHAKAQLIVVNEGEGPAIVKGARLSVDGVPEPAVQQALAKLLKVATDAKAIKQTASIAPGLVLRPSSEQSLFSIDAAGVPNVRDALANRVAVSICYCSLLGDCWIVQSAGTYPRSIRNCDEFADRGIDA